MESLAPTPQIAVQPRVARAAALPWYLTTLLLGSTSIIVGLIWDISWHMTIGRDTFWTPAHLAIYLGGVLAGLSGGWLAIHTTFAGTPDERASAVRFWGFRAPLGAWVAIWGAIAMITSAPFDNWWHNAYGLDVKIISPPHMVLAAGIISIQIAAMLLVLAQSNRAAAGEDRLLGTAFLYAAGVVLLNLATVMMEDSYPNDQHNAYFYKASCLLYPLLLAAVARASRLRWAATKTALFYTVVELALVWIRRPAAGWPVWSVAVTLPAKCLSRTSFRSLATTGSGCRSRPAEPCGRECSTRRLRPEEKDIKDCKDCKDEKALGSSAVFVLEVLVVLAVLYVLDVLSSSTPRTRSSSTPGSSSSSS